MNLIEEKFLQLELHNYAWGLANGFKQLPYKDSQN